MDEKINIRGNTASNLANGGLAAIQDNWIYYRNGNAGDRLYKIRTDGTGKEKFSLDPAYYINVVGEWVYFCNSHDNGGKIHKVRTNGKDSQTVNTDVSREITVIGDWIYYINVSDNDNIYKIRTNGKDRKKLTNSKGRASYLNVVDGWAYFIQTIKTYEDKVCKISADVQYDELVGYEKYSEIQELCEGSILYNLVEMGDCLYYSDMDSFHPIYTVRTDGSDKGYFKVKSDSEDEEGLDDIQFYKFNVTADWIYFSHDNSKQLHRIRIDGSKIQKLCDDECEQINVVGDWLYYESWDKRCKKYRVYRIRTDGTEREMVN